MFYFIVLIAPSHRKTKYMIASNGHGMDWYRHIAGGGNVIKRAQIAHGAEEGPVAIGTAHV